MSALFPVFDACLDAFEPPSYPLYLGIACLQRLCRTLIFFINLAAAPNLGIEQFLKRIGAELQRFFRVLHLVDSFPKRGADDSQKPRQEPADVAGERDENECPVRAMHGEQYGANYHGSHCEQKASGYCNAENHHFHSEIVSRSPL